MEKNNWKNLCYETQGISHIKDNVPCQDKTYFMEKNSCFVSALSDGAGSAKYSHYGAEIVVRTACEYICNNFDYLISLNDALVAKKSIISFVKEALEKKAEEIGTSIENLASTLLVTGIKDDKFLMFHVGDGIIGYSHGTNIKIASAPVNGEFANTTIFIGSQKALESCKLIKGPSSILDGVIMMSDGTAESLYNKKEKNLVKGAKKIIDFSAILKKQNMEKILEETFENLIKKKTQDDCSISLMFPQKTGEIYKRFSNLSRRDREILTRISPNNSGKKKKLKNYRDILFFLSKEESFYPHKKLKKFTKISQYLITKRSSELIQLGLIEGDSSKLFINN